MKFDPNKVTWRDTSDITFIACMIDDGIEDTQDQYNLFSKSEDKPHILNNETVNRALKLAEEDSVFIEIYEEQLNRWQNENLTTVQEKKINRISEELEKYRNLHQKYLDLLKKLSSETIEKKLDIEPEEPA